jgi:hypothetical protein
MTGAGALKACGASLRAVACRSVVPMPEHEGTPDLSALIRTHEDVFLDAPRCPICSYCTEGEDVFFGWFEAETATSPPMQMRLRQSAGFCPAHTRRTLRRPRLSPLPSVVGGALAQLSCDAPVRTECPACATATQTFEHARGLLHKAMESRALSARYDRRDAGACLPHLLDTVTGGGSDVGRRLTRRLRDDLASSPPFALLAGRDADAGGRGVLRAGLPELHAAGARTMGDTERAAWQIPACPACLAGGLAEQRYLSWRAEHERAGTGELEHDPYVLCAAHLHDLAAADAVAGERAAAQVRDHWLAQLDRALAAGSRSPGVTHRLRRRSAGPPAPRPARTACPACLARDGAEQRHADLVLRLLAQPAYAREYESTHGLCLRHVSAAPDTAAARLARTALRARLEAVAWEIDEVLRKQGWDARHERPGPERTAPLRLAALIDGRTFLGGPATTIP